MKIIVSPGPTFTHNPMFKLLNNELEAMRHELVALRPQHLRDADVFHVNFPEHMVSETRNFGKALASALTMLFGMLVMRLRGKPVVWTVHDVQPLRAHNPGLCRVYMYGVRSLVTGFIFLSQSSRQKFESLFPEQASKTMLNLFHPMFPVKILSEEEKRLKREDLGFAADEFVVGYLGDIKTYKNPSSLRFIPENLDDGRKVALLAAGRVDHKDASQEAVLKDVKHTRIDKRLDDDELSALIQIVDVAYLPYLWGWNSGFLFLVLSCRQRALTSNLPIFAEMQDYFGSVWVTPTDTTIDVPVKSALNQIAIAPIGDAERERLKVHIAALSFRAYAEGIEKFYTAPQRA